MNGIEERPPRRFRPADGLLAVVAAGGVAAGPLTPSVIIAAAPDSYANAFVPDR